MILQNSRYNGSVVCSNHQTSNVQPYSHDLPPLNPINEVGQPVHLTRGTSSREGLGPTPKAISEFEYGTVHPDKRSQPTPRTSRPESVPPPPLHERLDRLAIDRPIAGRSAPSQITAPTSGGKTQRLTSFFVRPGYGEKGRPLEISSNFFAVRSLGGGKAKTIL